MSNIDRDSPIPAYYQIRMDLMERIKRGEWAHTQQLPSEGVLAEQYQVSRITLRQALAELGKDGVIKKSRGRGSVICESPKPFVHKLDYTLVSTDETDDEDNRVSAQVLQMERFNNPYRVVYEALNITSDTPVVYLKRLFTINGKPLAVGRSWLSLERFPDLDKIGLEGNSLSRTLAKKYGVRAVRVDDSVEAVRPTQSECQVLDISYDCPLLAVHGVSYDENEMAIEYSTTFWLGDTVRFKITRDIPQ